MIDQLDDGGKLIFIRHAYAPGSGDPDNFNLNDCLTQRNLSNEGKNQAKNIGEFFRKNKNVILKPVHGYGGNDIFLLNKFERTSFRYCLFVLFTDSKNSNAEIPSINKS